jgi:phosphoglycerate dehydrogenase-like enzyme
MRMQAWVLGALGALGASMALTASADGRAAEPSVADLARELGIQESAVASRDLPGWRVPKRIYLRASDAARLPALQAVAPGVEFHVVRAGDRELPPADASLVVCTPAALAASPTLHWVQMISHGVDACLGNPEARQRIALMTTAKGTVSAAVADHAMALVLAHTRALDWYGVQQRRGIWAEDTAAAEKSGELQAQRELRGGTMLVYGLGGIGTEIATRAHAFGMRVIGIRASSRSGPPFVDYVGLPDELHRLAAQADFVVNVAPLTDATRRVFDDRFFAALRPGAYFVNVGRGESVDTEALLRALRSGRLAGAGLDVTDPEPLPAGHPLWTMPRVIVTPHSAGATVDGFERRWRLAIENVRRYVAGEPLLGAIDPRRGY